MNKKEESITVEERKMKVEYVTYLISGILQMSLVVVCNTTATIMGLLTVLLIYKTRKYCKLKNKEVYIDSFKKTQFVNLLGWVLIVVDYLAKYIMTLI